MGITTTWEMLLIWLIILRFGNMVFNCGEFNDLERELIKVLEKNKLRYYLCIKELNIDNNKLYFL